MIAAFLVAALATAGAAPESDSPDFREMNGEQIFATVCARCHGTYGRGNPPEEVLLGFEAPPRDFHDPYFNTRERRKDWVDVVKYGGPYRGLASTMPSFGDQLGDGQIAEVVDYLKSFVDESSYPQGETNFIRAHFVTKAFPEQEFLILPQVLRTTSPSVTETSVMFYYADRFSDRFQFEVKAPLINVAKPGSNEAGLGDTEIGIKWAFFDRRNVPFIAAAGLEAALPTGDSTRGFGEGAFVAVPYLAAGIGVAHLVQIQASTKLEAPIASGRTQLFVSALSTTLTLPGGRQGLFPGLELLAETPLNGDPAVLSLVPTLYAGLTKLGHVAVSAGWEIPVVGERQYDARIVAFFLWEYADGGIFW